MTTPIGKSATLPVPATGVSTAATTVTTPTISPPPTPVTPAKAPGDTFDTSAPRKDVISSPALTVPTRVTGPDPLGAVDPLDAARAQLAPMFDVVADSTDPAQRRPNQVTATEFKATVQLFSDVAAGKTQLTIDTDRKGVMQVGSLGFLPPLPPRLATAFREGTMKDVAAILQTPSGRALIDRLAHAPFPTRIVMSGDQRPEMFPNTLSGSNPKGNPATVQYLPGVSGAETDWATNPSAFPDPAAHVNPSHVTLYHELTHALDAVEGHRGDGLVADQDHPNADDAGKVSLEEYQAVGLGRFSGDAISENVYRAERARIGDGTIGVLPQDKGMPQREHYRMEQTGDSQPAIRDAAYVELCVLSQYNGDLPPSVIDMAKAAINDMDLAHVDALKPVLSQLVSPEYADAVAAKLSEGQPAVWKEWLAAHQQT
jgi:hypothetical protein